jgi:hypothetical protein
MSFLRPPGGTTYVKHYDEAIGKVALIGTSIRFTCAALDHLTSRMGSSAIL